jgi:protoporphyrinogen oxidase
MGSLIHCLESRLRERLGDRLKTGTSLSELPQDGNVILTVPAATAADFLKTRSPELAGTLSQIPYVSLVSATVFLKKSGLKRVPRGVGVLVAPNEKLRILGVLFNSSSFENRVVHSAWVSCTVLLGGTQDPAIMSESDEKIRMIIRSELDSLFGFEGDPVLEISIKKQKNAIPLYNSDLCQFWKKAKETWCSVPGQVLFGNYTGKVSIRGMIETVSDDLKFPSFK